MHALIAASRRLVDRASCSELRRATKRLPSGSKNAFVNRDKVSATLGAPAAVKRQAEHKRFLDLRTDAFAGARNRKLWQSPKNSCQRIGGTAEGIAHNRVAERPLATAEQRKDSPMQRTICPAAASCEQDVVRWWPDPNWLLSRFQARLAAA